MAGCIFLWVKLWDAEVMVCMEAVWRILSSLLSEFAFFPIKNKGKSRSILRIVLYTLQVSVYKVQEWLRKMGMVSCKTYYYRIGSSIRRKLQEKGLTQEELAEAAGLSLKMVQKMEGGQKGFRMETVIKIAETLGVTLGSLADTQGEDERTLFCREMFYELARDKSDEEIRYAVGIVDSVFKLHKQYLE